MKDFSLIFIFLTLIPLRILSQDSNAEFEKLVSNFCSEYKALNIPPLRISYADNLAAIGDNKALQKQESLVVMYKELLSSHTVTSLNAKNRLDYDLLTYLLALETERIALEKVWIQAGQRENFGDGLATIPMGKEWYAHFLKRWIDLEVHPDTLFQFGLKEIDKVKGEIRSVQQKSGRDSIGFMALIEDDHFYIQDVEEVQRSFESYDSTLIEKLGKFFPYTDQIPPVKIAKSVDRRLAQVPGFYRNNTFFYTKFEYPFNKRQIAWLYLHEAIPGHHYEISLRRVLEISELQSLFYLPGYSEGWAAYVEEIGKEIGAYASIYDELGKWEWDLIRSVRVPLDVGLNFYQWSDEKALKFWQSHIKGQDDIGHREIARMKRWPAQVITYKYGANKILKWKAMLEEKEGFTLKSFHQEVIRRGPLPFSILESLVLQE